MNEEKIEKHTKVSMKAFDRGFHEGYQLAMEEILRHCEQAIEEVEDARENETRK